MLRLLSYKILMIQDQNLNEAVYISDSTNIFWRVTNQTIFLFIYWQIVAQ